jgi:hypothetical protein
VWSVEFASEAVEKEIASLIRARKFSRSDQMVIHAWIRQITYHGPESVRGDSKWADHALVDEWEGYRASFFTSSKTKS